MRQVAVHSGTVRQIVRKEGEEQLLAVTVPQELPADRCIKTSISAASGRPMLLEVTVPPDLSAGASFHVRYKPEPSSPSSPSRPAHRINVATVEEARHASEPPPSFDPRIVVVKRGSSFDTFDEALLPPPPPEAPPAALFSEEEMLQMDDDELLAAALQASQADAARLVAFPAIGGETSGQLSRRRRQILAEATPGAGVSARVTFGDEAARRSSMHDSMHSPCTACNGLGKTSPFISVPLAAMVLRGAEGVEEYSCGVCFGDGEYKMSADCGGAHYYCADCIRGSLTVRGACRSNPRCHLIRA